MSFQKQRSKGFLEIVCNTQLDFGFVCYFIIHYVFQCQAPLPIRLPLFRHDLHTPRNDPLFEWHQKKYKCPPVRNTYFLTLFDVTEAPNYLAFKYILNCLLTYYIDISLV